MSSPLSRLLPVRTQQPSARGLIQTAQRWIHSAAFHYCWLSFLSAQFPRLCVPGLGGSSHDVQLVVTMSRGQVVDSQVTLGRDILEKLDACRVAWQSSHVLRGEDDNVLSLLLVSMTVTNGPDVFHLMSLIFNHATREYYLFEPLGQREQLTASRQLLLLKVWDALQQGGYQELAAYTFVPIHTVCMLQKYGNQATVIQQLRERVEAYIQANLLSTQQQLALRESVSQVGQYMATLGNCDVWNLIFIHSLLANPDMRVGEVAKMLTRTLRRLGKESTPLEERERLRQEVDQLVVDMKLYMAMVQQLCARGGRKPRSGVARWCLSASCRMVQANTVTDADVDALAQRVREQADDINTLLQRGLDEWQRSLQERRPMREMSVDDFLELLLMRVGSQLE